MSKGTLRVRGLSRVYAPTWRQLVKYAQRHPNEVGPVTEPMARLAQVRMAQVQLYFGQPDDELLLQSVESPN